MNLSERIEKGMAADPIGPDGLDTNVWMDEDPEENKLIRRILSRQGKKRAFADGDIKNHTDKYHLDQESHRWHLNTPENVRELRDQHRDLKEDLLNHIDYNYTGDVKDQLLRALNSELSYVPVVLRNGTVDDRHKAKIIEESSPEFFQRYKEHLDQHAIHLEDAVLGMIGAYKDEDQIRKDPSLIDTGEHRFAQRQSGKYANWVMGLTSMRSDHEKVVKHMDGHDQYHSRLQHLQHDGRDVRRKMERMYAEDLIPVTRAIEEAKAERRELADKANRMQEITQSSPLDVLSIIQHHHREILEQGQQVDSRVMDLTQKQHEAMEKIRELVKIPEDQRGRVRWKLPPQGSEHVPAFRPGLDAFNALVHKDTLPEEAVQLLVLPAGARAFARSSDKSISISPLHSAGVVVHELGHFLEDVHPYLVGASLDFRDTRTSLERARKLNDIWKNRGFLGSFDDHEVACEDHFIDPYIGKIYGGKSSEVMSMGLQMMHEDPFKLATLDPHYFDFVFAAARAGGGKL